MKPYTILTDACLDLPKELIARLKIKVVPMMVTIEGHDYLSDANETEITYQAFYELLRNEKVAKTSQLNPNDQYAAMKSLIEQGQDVLVISFSSALSGTYQSAVLAKKDLESEYPDAKIVCIDSLCASMGLGLLVTYAAQKALANEPLMDVANWVEETKLSISHLFTVGDLNHLKRGGRLSASKAFIGTLIQLKPLLHVDEKGRLVPYANVRGRQQAIKRMVDRFIKTAIHPENQIIYISHGDCLEEALLMKDEILKQVKVKEILIHYIGPVIGAHSGLGTLALFYLGNERL